MDSLVRACAGLNHVLLEATGDGHCALPVEFLKDEAGKLLLVATSIVDGALARTLSSGEVVQEAIGGQELIFLPSLKRAEEGIASRIRNLCAAPPNYPAIDLEKAVTWCQEDEQGTCCEPARGFEAGIDQPGAHHHWRSGCRQNHSGQRHPAHPLRQESALSLVRTHGACSQAPERNNRLGG